MSQNLIRSMARKVDPGRPVKLVKKNGPRRIVDRLNEKSGGPVWLEWLETATPGNNSEKLQIISSPISDMNFDDLKSSKGFF